MAEHPLTCACHHCALRAQGLSVAEIRAAHDRWAASRLRKVGWYAHYERSCTGLNAHTHGLQQLHNHPDLQVVLPFREETIHNLFGAMAKRVIAGHRYKPGDILTDLLQNNYVVKLVAAVEDDRPVLRLILPDEQNQVDRDKMAEPYNQQYADLGKEKHGTRKGKPTKRRQLAGRPRPAVRPR